MIMLGPIDYVIVGFKGNKFDGSILEALAEAIDNGVIRLIALSLVSKDNDGEVTTSEIADYGDDYIVEFAQKHQLGSDLVTTEDVNEVGELLENNCSAGLLVIEQLWAKPLKKALLNANGFLIGEGRIHPEAAAELSNQL